MIRLFSVVYILYVISLAACLTTRPEELKLRISASDHPTWQKTTPDPSYRLNTSTAILKSLDVLEKRYFKIWPGVWPTGIDWTSAVVGTYLAEVLFTLSSSLSGLTTPTTLENLINRYFSHSTASFFGQDIFSLRQEANDDMLWVVIEWLRGIKFIEEHSSRYKSESIGGEWYGKEWISPFAHRARIFWDQASQGWNTTLCDGGMIWSPKLLPYKNAITNELYISASIAMYLYFPGDPDTSPFEKSSANFSVTGSSTRSHDPKYLVAAIDAYKWLMSSNMTNSQGLFVDGYHISGLSSGVSNNTKCDERNEMVYTYNQAVLLSGQNGIYHATGNRLYLEDGHQLVANVISATGWDLENDETYEPIPENPSNVRFGKWHGLGRYGVLEEICDSSATCSQDSQTFKGIYFLHLTSFCTSLNNPALELSNTSTENFEETQKWHNKKCQSYGPWIRHNAQAALKTLDSNGLFGAWWNIPANTSTFSEVENYESQLPAGKTDYRNFGLPAAWASGNLERHQIRQKLAGRDGDSTAAPHNLDLNDRGRGRTLETQFGGLSVLRALWEIVESR